MKRLITVFVFFFMMGWVQTHAQTTVFFEDFDNPADSTTLANWTQRQLYTTNPTQDFWKFNNPGARSIGGTFSGSFAIFDSEHYSNNNLLEVVALESPKFNTSGLDKVFITFNFAANRNTTNVYRLMVQTFNGKIWEDVFEYVDSVTAFQRDTFDVSNLIRNTCDAQVRFRWTCQSGGWAAIDNFRVFSPASSRLTTNVQLVEMLSPLPSVCVDPNARVSVRFKNAGTASVSNIPFRVSIFDGAATESFNYTLNQTIGVCADTVIVFPNSIDIVRDSAFRFTIYSDLSGDQSRINSDTIVIANFRNLPSPPLVNVDSFFCGTPTIVDSIGLNANQTALWFRNINDTVPAFTGPKATIGRVDSTITYHVETRSVQRFCVPNARNAAVPNGAAFQQGIQSGVFIDIIAKQDITLDSLELVMAVAGTMDYEVYYCKGPYAQNFNNFNNWTFAHGGRVTPVGRTAVYAGRIKIRKGDTIGVHLYDVTGNRLIFHQGAPHVFENNFIKTFSSDVLNGAAVTGPKLGGSGFGYILNFHYTVECTGVFSERKYNSVPFPATSINYGTPFEGTQQGQRDLVLAGKTVTYEMPAPFGKTNNDFGTKWTITSLEVITNNGFVVPANQYTLLNNPPSGNNNLGFRFTPGSNWTDSTIIINAVVKDLDIFPFCENLLRKTLFVAPLPRPNFAYNPTCQRSGAFFQNQSSISSGFNTFKWFFGDGDSSTLPSPTHVYKDFGNFDVRLVATSDLGFVKDTTIRITVLETPQVDFTAGNQCRGLNFITQNNTVYGSGNYTSFWRFGDGNTSTLKEPVFTYANTGTYNVRLIVTGDNGCRDSLTKQSTMFESPVSAFTPSANDVCQSVTIQFQNQSTINTGTFGSSWNFGGVGSSNAANPSFRFPASGSYDVRLITQSTFGCRDTLIKTIIIKESPLVDFVINGECNQTPLKMENLTQIPSSVTPTFSWNFNGQASSSDENPEILFPVIGLKNISLKITYDNGCENTAAKSVVVKQQAKAQFTASKACAGEEVVFANGTQIVPGTMSYNWSFGDGNSAIIRNPTHTYSTTGGQTFAVKLLVTVNDACPDSIENPILIGEQAVCDFTIQNDYLPGHRTYKFIPARSGYVSYSWNFGDGKTSSDPSPVHQYTADGSYTIQLNAETSDGCKCSLTQTKEVLNLTVRELENGGSIQLYPNPTNSELNVQYDLKEEVLSITLYDNAGKQVQQVQNNRFGKGGIWKADVSQLAAGTYTVKILTSNGVHTLRFVAM